MVHRFGLEYEDRQTDRGWDTMGPQGSGPWRIGPDPPLFLSDPSSIVYTIFLVPGEDSCLLFYRRLFQLLSLFFLFFSYSNFPPWIKTIALLIDHARLIKNFNDQSDGIIHKKSRSAAYLIFRKTSDV